MFIIFSGVSGCGKQTVIQRVMEIFPNAAFVKSATTRAPRQSNPFEHYFMSKRQFDSKVKRGEFFEHVVVHGQQYGILNKDLETVLANPEKIFMRDVDVLGTVKLKQYLTGKTDVISIFLECPDDVLKKRLLNRGESEESANLRLQRGEFERQYKDKYDYVIENIDLNKTVAKVKKIINEHQKPTKK